MYALSPDLRGESGADAGDGACACGIPTGLPTERGQCPRPIIRLCRNFLRAMRGGGGGGGVTLCFHCYYFVFLAFCRFCRRFCQYCFRYGFASFDDTRKHYQFVTASAVNPVFACTVGRKYNMGNMKCNSQSQRAGSAPSPLRLAPHPHRLTCLHDWISPLARCISPWKL